MLVGGGGGPAFKLGKPRAKFATIKIANALVALLCFAHHSFLFFKLHHEFSRLRCVSQANGILGNLTNHDFAYLKKLGELQLNVESVCSR